MSQKSELDILRTLVHSVKYQMFEFNFHSGHVLKAGPRLDFLGLVRIVAFEFENLDRTQFRILINSNFQLRINDHIYFSVIKMFYQHDKEVHDRKMQVQCHCFASSSQTICKVAVP